MQTSGGASGTTIFWRDQAGHVISETDQNGNVNNNYVYFNGQAVAWIDIGHGVPTKYQYYIHDHLGTTRMITTSTGAVCYDADFFPWGGEQHVFTNSCSQNYKFTAKERDPDTGSDYFGARWFRSTISRFYSPDPLLNSGHPENPQTWNRYVYTLNNPLRLVDPFGLYEWAPSGCRAGDEECAKNYKKWQQKFRDALVELKMARDFFTPGSMEYNRLNAALAAYGEENKANGVSVGFGAVAPGAAETVPMNNNTSWAVTFDTKKLNGSIAWAMAAGHEGTHVNDFGMPLGDFMKQSPFSMEYRGYETSSWVAQGLGASKRSFSGNVIWNSSWAQADRATLRDKGITKEVLDHYPDHPETQPHNPLPN